MRSKSWLIILAFCVLGSASGFGPAMSSAWAQRPQRSPAPPARSAPESQSEKPVAPAEPGLPADAVTSHKLALKDQNYAYTARAGALPLTDGKGNKTGEIFFVAFTRDGADPAKRPITFALNGGPGAASDRGFSIWAMA